MGKLANVIFVLNVIAENEEIFLCYLSKHDASFAPCIPKICSDC